MLQAVAHLTAPPVPVPGATPASTFFFDETPIRVITLAGEPRFVAVDICKALGLIDVSDAVEKLDADEKGRASVPTLRGLQDLLVVSESGLYTMIIRCRSAVIEGSAAHRFKR